MELLLLDAGFGGLGEMVIKVLLNALALMAGAHLLKGVEIEDFTRAVIIAVFLSVLNATLGSFLDFITTPLRFLTLGLFAFVVDAAMLLLAAHFMKGFNIRNFVSAFFLAIIFSITNAVLYAIFL
ncbi:MAG: phage holin family protein [Lewinellaceae bacterium]|nr:phage holin family protein [Phaeodactylibacter sp.]MCB9039591.1 phage holin family protein [Lewinellaceae bacterium]